MSGIPEHGGAWNKYDPFSRAYMDPMQKNGPTRILKAADPKIIAALRAEKAKHPIRFGFNATTPMKDKVIFEIKRSIDVQSD